MSPASKVTCALLAAAISHAVAISGVHFEKHRNMQMMFGGLLYEQVLYNDGDTVYYGHLELGGQNISGIIDTGSFELVVFSSKCSTCGTAAKYDDKLSPAYKAGNWMTTHSYGSGSCSSVSATDSLAVGPAEKRLFTRTQFFWEATTCMMPLLMNAPFNAIVGVGPPGQPEYTAQQSLESAMAKANPNPNQIKSLREQLKFTQETDELLQNFNVQTFSECLGVEAGSSGKFVWNDEDRKGLPGVVTAKVEGQITWGVRTSEMGLATAGSDVLDIEIGCNPSCGAIVDTGTTLLALPTNVYNNLYNKLSSMNTGCADLSVFPDLVMKLDGQALRLPPEAYISAATGYASSYVRKVMHIDDRPSPFAQSPDFSSAGGSIAQCMLMVMDGGMLQTQLGPQMIIGMAVFREYYTTFDLGTGPGDRTISFMPKDKNCNPSLSLQAATSSMREGPRPPTTIDASKIRVKEMPSRAGRTLI